MKVTLKRQDNQKIIQTIKCNSTSTQQNIKQLISNVDHKVIKQEFNLIKNEYMIVDIDMTIYRDIKEFDYFLARIEVVNESDNTVLAYANLTKS